MTLSPHNSESPEQPEATMTHADETQPAKRQRPVIAIDGPAASTETIWVEVAGDQPQLALDEIAAVQGLTFSPWVNRKHELVRAFRAEAITIDGTARRSAA